ncbi:MAG: glycosyltransferase family 4 protein [Terrisporobacter othiniensis]|uniref:glycosyltransferase family 4 protein n=1 Tax=Terrisporobacter othiniensis TaxID=1577792 RepID=UPI0029084951|nr:glycosyltransferase family 4 protein [Terrisporobacter othiniensis]MDU6983195.1 glycosyltransferase family 4 protein [Terrisporobacter othiniensis]
MNILHVVFSFNNGGIENLLVDLFNNWNYKDKNYLCIVNDNYDLELIEKISSVNIEVIKMNRPVGGSKFEYIKKLNEIIRKYRIDILHCHSNSSVKFCIYSKILNPNIKLVYTVHDTMAYQELSKIDILIHKIFINNIIAISRCVYETIKKRFNNKNKISIIYNAVDTRKFKLEECKNKKHISGLKICCVARLDYKIKGQDILIKALGELKKKRKDFRCMFIGGEPTETNNNLSELKVLAEKLNVLENISFLGNCNNVHEILGDFDICIVPSRKEGFGISIIEAFLSKVLVIASDIEGPRELIGENEYGYLFELENYKMLSNLIDSIDLDYSKNQVEKSYDYAVKNFSIDAMINSLRKLYI